jgi:hypothetical protein
VAVVVDVIFKQVLVVDQEVVEVGLDTVEDQVQQVKVTQVDQDTELTKVVVEAVLVKQVDSLKVAMD